MRAFAEGRDTGKRTHSARMPSRGRGSPGAERDRDPVRHPQHALGNQAVQRLCRTGAGGRGASSRIPFPAEEQGYSVRQPPAAPGSPAPAPTPAADSCGTPRRMVAVTSGTFHGGLALSTYYPYLVGRGYWVSDTTAGPFNTGSRVGSAVQLYGLVPSFCQPSQYRLEQTYQDTLLVRNGVHDPEEGQVIDDFARSGQDQSRPPFRQLFLDTVGAGGLAISMGDPPSEAYGPADNIEWDCTYVTSLAGPVGRVSVTWSTSVRVVNGTVTRNTVS